MQSKRKTPPVKSLENALDILDLLGESSRPMNATEIAQRVGGSISGVYKTLSTFVDREYLSYEQSTKQYRLHTKILRYASSIHQNEKSIQIALPVMIDLAEKTKETVHFGKPEGYYGVFIEKVNSPHTVAVQTRIGTRVPFNRGATSKAMMAFLPEYYFKNFCDNFLDDGTENGKKLVEEAIEVRKTVRRQGYVVTYEEVNPNVAAIAAPVFGFLNQLIGSIAIAGLKDRFPPDVVTSYIPVITQACRKISIQLGATDLPDVYQ